MAAPEEEEKRLQIRASTLLPFSAEDVAAIAASEEGEGSTGSSRDQAVPTAFDFGTFKKGVLQYSHAHWNVAGAGRSRRQAGEQIAVDPTSLRADRDSLRADICSSASSTSLASVKSGNVDKTSIKPATSSAPTTTTSGNGLSLSPAHNSSLSVTQRFNTAKTATMDSPTLRDMPVIAAADPALELPSFRKSDDVPSVARNSTTTPSDDTATAADDASNQDDLVLVDKSTQVKDFADNLSDSSNQTAKATDNNDSDISNNQGTHNIQRTFPLLKKRPPPIITDHPAYGSDPFTSSSESPSISSSWTPSQVRNYNENHKSSNDEAPKPKNNLLNLVRANNPDSELITLAAAAKEGPPETSPGPAATTLTRRASLAILPGSRRQRTSFSTTPTTPATRKFSPFSLRGLANALQQQPRPPSPPDFSREERLQHQEYRIRAKTATLPRANASMFPTHPDTGRNWMHRNLRCIACSKKGCANCGKSCCAWQAAMRGLENHKGNEEGLKRAEMIKEEIERVDVTGKEVGTFLKCSDCGKEVCPECCGECCDEICKLICCRKCKSDPWDVCDYHRDL
jgi:hypothetical protein